MYQTKFSYPSQYYTSQNAQYKQFVKDFAEAVAGFEKQKKQMQDGITMIMQDNKHKMESAMISTIFGGNAQMPHLPGNEILAFGQERDKIQQKIYFLTCAVDCSSEYDFETKRDEALLKIEMLDNPLAKLQRRK